MFCHINWFSKFFTGGYDYLHSEIEGEYSAYLPDDREPCPWRKLFCKKTFRMFANTVGIIIELCTFSLVMTQFFTMYYTSVKVMSVAVPILILYTVTKRESRPVVAQYWFQTLFGVFFWFYQINLQLLPNLLESGMLFKGLWNLIVRDLYVYDAGKQCSFPFALDGEGNKTYNTHFVIPGETHCFRIVRSMYNLEYSPGVDTIWGFGFAFTFSFGMSTVAGLFDYDSWVYRLLPKIFGKYNEVFVLFAGFLYWYIFQVILESYYAEYFPDHITIFGVFFMIAQLIAILDAFLNYVMNYFQNRETAVNYQNL